MAMPWVNSVRSTGQLTAHLASGLTGGWLSIVNDAIAEFNRLSQRHSLGVTIETVDDDASANIIIDTGNGQVSFTYEGTTYAGNFDGRRMHGWTRLVNDGSSVVKAYVYLPSDPQINEPSSGQRAVGDEVKKVIAVHELVHAAGLTNDDHQTSDLFQASPDVDITVRGDRVRYQVRGGNYQYMPPMRLASETISLIRQNW